MFQVQTMQIQRPLAYGMLDQEGFLEAQIIAQKEVSKYMKYRDFCKKAELLREKTGIHSQDELEEFLSE